MGMFCSTIIPTVNRPTLNRAVCSILDQDFMAADFEVIVVNDSGQPLPDSDWQHHDQVRVINTNRRERSVARNTGAAISLGKYLHFLDDDDVLLPGAMEAFWLHHQINEAAWLFGGWQTVDNDSNLVNEFTPALNGNIFALLVAGEGLPLQASLVRTEFFFNAGTFDPAITGVEDRDLGRRIALLGDIAYIDSIVARIRIGELGSTTDWARIAEDDRWGREKALSAPSAFSRLKASANSSYLHGRVTRAYLASMIWNLQRKQGFNTLKRASSATIFAGLHVLSPEFWRGLGTKIK